MNTDTPRTDKCLTFDSIALCETLERELNAVTEQRDEALSDLEFRRDLFKLQEQQLNDVRAERDMLAEALRKLTEYDLGDIPIGIIRKCNEVLQSLTTNVKVHTPLPASASSETEVKP